MIKSVPNQLVLVREWTKEINKRINQVKLQKTQNRQGAN